MDLPVISGLRADIVPHRQWAVSKWLYANELWYYHRLGTDDEIGVRRKFYRLMDEDLRDLCYMLHEAGLNTTPSCQGHFYDRSHFERIWDELVREAGKIQRDGLKVTDSQTQKGYLFLEKDYRLPWDRFELFHDHASSQQGIGYLGVFVPGDRDDLLARIDAATFSDSNAEIAYDRILSRLLHGHMFNIFVRSSGPDERERSWRLITNLMSRALEGANRPEMVATSDGFWNSLQA